MVAKRSNHAAEKSPQNFRARQSPLQQSPDNIQQVLQPMQVSLSHTILPDGMEDGMTTHKHGKRHVSVVPR
jgi:hypothetical protein